MQPFGGVGFRVQGLDSALGCMVYIMRLCFCWLLQSFSRLELYGVKEARVSGEGVGSTCVWLQ